VYTLSFPVYTLPEEELSPEYKVQYKCTV